MSGLGLCVEEWNEVLEVVGRALSFPDVLGPAHSHIVGAVVARALQKACLLLGLVVVDQRVVG
ncbi:hypothetical protein [Candidatus Thiodiazotropha sp. CDECU1]|uniref:hypothetical protein n=1 Tax=Candidatus Thiodiazotropha sp. CDECU1 TaxID=3065865 RepID=UPI002930BD77|nr:hypothetical protein [Candidatus Thiodiazotropha sp. CDECU1]